MADVSENINVALIGGHAPIYPENVQQWAIDVGAFMARMNAHIRISGLTGLPMHMARGYHQAGGTSITAVYPHNLHVLEEEYPTYVQAEVATWGNVHIGIAPPNQRMATMAEGVHGIFVLPGAEGTRKQLERLCAITNSRVPIFVMTGWEVENADSIQQFCEARPDLAHRTTLCTEGLVRALHQFRHAVYDAFEKAKKAA